MANRNGKSIYDMPYVTPAVHRTNFAKPQEKNGFIDDKKECANRQKMNVIEITR